MKDKKYWISIIVLSLIFIVNTILVVCGKTTLFDNFIYNAVRSCFGSGTWMGDKPWLGTDPWRNN